MIAAGLPINRDDNVRCFSIMTETFGPRGAEGDVSALLTAMQGR